MFTEGSRQATKRRRLNRPCPSTSEEEDKDGERVRNQISDSGSVSEGDEDVNKCSANDIEALEVGRVSAEVSGGEDELAEVKMNSSKAKTKGVRLSLGEPERDFDREEGGGEVRKGKRKEGPKEREKIQEMEQQISVSRFERKTDKANLSVLSHPL